MLAHIRQLGMDGSCQQWFDPGRDGDECLPQAEEQSDGPLMFAIRAKRGGACVEKQRLLREMVRFRAEKHPIVLGLIADQKPRPEVTRTWVTFLHQDTGFLDGGEIMGKKFNYPVFCLLLSPVRKRGYYHAVRPAHHDSARDSRGRDHYGIRAAPGAEYSGRTGSVALDA